MKTEAQINEQINTLTALENTPPADDDTAIAQAAVIEVAKAVLQWVLADEASDPKLTLKGLRTS